AAFAVFVRACSLFSYLCILDCQREILEGMAHGPWMDTYWLYFLSIAFFIVTAASIAYFVFISANRLYNMSRSKRNENRLKSEAKKAINSDSSMCAVCIESYKVGDVVTVLTCDHIFHKTCIEPWLLERRTCPMCKCDILKEHTFVWKHCMACISLA
uniref:RING-type domain-containing protein n=1 Tax=Oreochromis aureus TaxID=47969 RepID=A0AAZ1XAR7_OREAU